MSGHFCTSAEVSSAQVSYGHFGTGAEVSRVRSVCTPTLSKPIWFSIFFHCWKEEQIVNETHIISATTLATIHNHFYSSRSPKVCCRITRGKSKFKFATSSALDRRFVDLLWCLLAKLSLTDVIFVHPGMKSNSGYNCDMLLSQQLLPVMCNFLHDFFIFCTRGMRYTVRFLEQSTPAFIPIPPDLCDRQIVLTLITRYAMGWCPTATASVAAA